MTSFQKTEEHKRTPITGQGKEFVKFAMSRNFYEEFEAFTNVCDSAKLPEVNASHLSNRSFVSYTGK